MAPYLLVGGLCGLTWATALRGWMVELVRAESSVSWLTFALLMLPGLVVGMLLGWAAYHRVSGADSPHWLVLSPVALAVAIADPEIFSALIHTGEGGGSLGVVMTALAAGHVLSRHRWSLARVATALLAATGLLGGGVHELAGWITDESSRAVGRPAGVHARAVAVPGLLAAVPVNPHAGRTDRSSWPRRALWPGVGRSAAGVHGRGRRRGLAGAMGQHVRLHPAPRGRGWRAARLGGKRAVSGAATVVGGVCAAGPSRRSC